MPKFMSHNLHTAIDIGGVLSAHAAAIIISFTNVAESLKILSLLLAIGYTMWKWVVEYKQHKKKGKNVTKR